MENTLPPELKDLKQQIELINKHGIPPEKLVGIVDTIVNGDMSNKDFKKSDIPLAKAKDKPKEATRIINNYNTALNALVEDKKSGKDDETKSVLKLSIIVGAAASGLEVLGMKKEDIIAALGLTVPTAGGKK